MSFRKSLEIAVERVDDDLLVRQPPPRTVDFQPLVAVGVEPDRDGDGTLEAARLPGWDRSGRGGPFGRGLRRRTVVRRGGGFAFAGDQPRFKPGRVAASHGS